MCALMKIPASSDRLNIADMRKRLGNNDPLIADLLRMFVEAQPAQLASIKAAVDARDPDAVRRSAHSMKGTAANLAAVGVAGAAAALEDAAERGETTFGPLFAKLQLEVEQLVAELME